MRHVGLHGTCVTCLSVLPGISCPKLTIRAPWEFTGETHARNSVGDGRARPCGQEPSSAGLMAEGPLQSVGVGLCQALEESFLQAVALLLQVRLQQSVYPWDDTPSPVRAAQP